MFNRYTETKIKNFLVLVFVLAFKLKISKIKYKQIHNYNNYECNNLHTIKTYISISIVYVV